jgi:signal transduction histidine kinase/ligand-binding sensor domain-containing protein
MASPMTRAAIFLLLASFSAMLRAAPFDEVPLGPPLEMLARTWTTEDGLPENHVRAITRTRDGFLWLGTNAGVARFDGVQFKTYGLREGLGSVIILSLFEAHDGALWIGTLGGGASVIRNGRIVKTYTRADGLPSASVATIAEDATGNLWAASGAGVVRLEGDRFVKMSSAPRSGNAGLHTWYLDHEGAFWMAFREGIWRWQEGKWISGSKSGPLYAAAFCEDLTGNLWVADHGRRLWCLQKDRWFANLVPEKIPGSRGISITATRDGMIWMALADGAVCGFRDGRFVVPAARNGLAIDTVESMYAMADGQLWLGSYSGLHALKRPRTRVATVGDGGTNHLLSLIELEPGEFAVGTRGRGLFRWKDGNAKRFEDGLATAADDDDDVHAMLRTRDGSLWVAATEGFQQFQNARRVPLPDIDEALRNERVLTMCEDSTEGLWLGTASGRLYRIENDRCFKVKYGGDVQSISTLLPESDGTLWIGTRGNGLFRLNGKEHRHFQRGDGLGSDVIAALYLTGDGGLWVGTAGGGLAHRQADRFISLNTREGLPDDTVSQIIADEENRLWLGTNRGIAVLKKAELEACEPGKAASLHPLLINRAEGMLTEECTHAKPLKTCSNEFAFPTARGFVLMRPTDFRADDTTPPVFIETVSANGKPVDTKSDSVMLSPDLDRLDIHFTGLHFAAPEQLRFRHRLTGLEKDWNDVGATRNVEYRNLAPGRYVFEVVASTGNGKWSQHPASIAFTLAPHWWQSSSFRAGIVLTCLGLVGFLVRQRERVVARRKIEALERQHAVDQERARIARDLHDDVGASLTQMAMLSEMALDQLTNQPRHVQEQIHEICTTARDATKSLDEIIWVTNPTQDTLDRFIHYLYDFVQSYSSSAGLATRLDIPMNLPASPMDATTRHHLYLVTKEVLHNIVKHANATEVKFGIALDLTSLRITIEDNGRGFSTTDSPNEPGADGLHNIRQRLENVEGSCCHRSEPGRGTSVEMTVPLKIA